MTASGAHRREIAVGAAIAVLLGVLAVWAPGYFSGENLRDLFLANLPVLLMSLGMSVVILTGQIDISVGSVFAIASVVMGVCARAGWPPGLCALAATTVGLACGAMNGVITAFVGVPSIVVTLATMVMLRDGLRWETQGAWVGDLPARFPWFGWGQGGYTAVMAALAAGLVVLFAWGLRSLRAGRAVYATGSSEAAARSVGIRTERVVFGAFALLGALTGMAGALNAVRFGQVPSNAGIGLEMKVIAAVAVGGAAVTGGSGTIAGTVLGVVLLGSIGTALTFLGVNAAWERAIQGAIILGAVAMAAVGPVRRWRGTAVVAARG